MLKRFMSILLAIVMAVGVFPATIFAEGEWELPEGATPLANSQITVSANGLGCFVSRDAEDFNTIVFPETITDEDWQNAAVDGVVTLRIELTPPETMNADATSFVIECDDNIPALETIASNKMWYYWVEEERIAGAFTLDIAEINEDGSVNYFFGREFITTICVAWEYNGVRSYQYMTYCLYNENAPQNGGNGGNGGNGTPEWLRTWDGHYVDPSQVSLDIPQSLRKAVSVGFNNGTAIVTLDVDKLSEADWIAAYEEVGAMETQIRARINVAPSVNGIDEVYDENGNGAEPIEQFISNSDKNEHWEYDEYSRTGGHAELAQIYKEDGKVTIIPTVRNGNHYFKVAWYDVDGEDREGNPIPPIYQIMPYYGEIKGNIKSYTFDDVLDYVGSERIVFDGKVNTEEKLSVSYNAAEGKVLYKYNHTGDVNVNTPTAIFNDLFTAEEGDNNGYYHLYTEVDAPDGYKLKGEPDDATEMRLRTIAARRNVIQGHSRTWQMEWELIDKTQISESKPEFINEWLTVDFDPGINFMDVLWDPVTDETRLSYYTKDEVATSKQALIDGSLTMEFSNGLFHSGFDTSKKFNAEIVPNAMISVNIPNDGKTYVAYKVNESGGGREIYYNQELQNDQDIMIRGGDFYPINDWRFRCVNIAQFRLQTVNGIDVLFTMDAGGEQVFIVDWYEADENGDPLENPSKREYIYVKTDDYINEVTTDSVTEGNLSEEVGAPTPIGSNWKLTCNHFPQNGREDAYYFQLEANNAPEGEKTIYIPYSYLDENLTYEKAVSMKLQPKLHHYDDGHSQIELLKGELTPYGMRFVVESFSPFVIAYDVAEDSEVEYNVEIGGLEAVPEELKQIFGSVEEIETELTEEIFAESKLDENKATIEFMEIELMIKDPRGNWIEVDPEDFPANGVEVCIPYPQGVDKDEYDFTVAHLISYGPQIGEVEILEPEETEQGLKVKVYSLSPFAVAYQKTENKPVNKPEPEKETTTVIIDMTAKEDEENPNTGAPVIG